MKNLPFAEIMQKCKKLVGKEVLYSEFGNYRYFIIEIHEGGFRLSEYKKKTSHQRRGQKTSASWFGTRQDLQTAVQLNSEWYGMNHITNKIDGVDNWELFLKSFTHRELRQYDPLTATGLPSYEYVPVDRDDGNMDDNV